MLRMVRERTARDRRPTSVLATALTALVLVTVGGSGCGGDDESSASKVNSQTPAPAPAPAPAKSAIDRAAYTTRITNPYFPLSLVPLTVFEGTERNRRTGKTVKTRDKNRVLTKHGRVAGVAVTIVNVTEYANGKLAEHTLDYYAQRRDGSVWYFGERVDEYENGKIVGHGGEWLAGKGKAKPGLFMPIKPKVGQEFEQERAPGIAEDRSKVVAAGLKVKVPAGTFDNCIRTKDFSPLDKATEFKFYCAGIGLVREGKSKLARYRRPPGA
jgi:hypothetical protein